MANTENNHTDYVEEVIVVRHSDHQKEDALLKPDVGLMILTWVSFFVLLAILWKFAWNPILQGLEKREEDLRRSVDEADRLRREMERIEDTRRKALLEAQRQSEVMVEEARHAAVEAGKVIEKRTKEQAQIILENAERDAKDATNKAYADLKKQSADLVVDLASKLIRENMNDEKNKKLVSGLLKEM